MSRAWKEKISNPWLREITLILVFLGILKYKLPNHFMSLKTTYGLFGTDFEGTVWYRWVVSKNAWTEFNSIWGVAEKWDLSPYLFFNLYDQLQSLSVKLLFNSEAQGIFFISNLGLIICMVLNCYSASKVASLYTKNLIFRIASGIFVGISPMNILSYRTGMANTAIFISIFAIYFLIKGVRNSSTGHIVFAGILAVIQISTFTYNAMPAVLFSILLFVTRIIKSKGKMNWKVFVYFFTILFLGAFLRYRKQLYYLSANSEATQEFRKVSWENEYVKVETLLRESSGNHIPLILLFLYTISLIYCFVKINRIFQDDLFGELLTSFVSLTIIFLLVFRTPLDLLVHSIYQQMFPSFRGVNYYWKFATLFMIPIFSFLFEKASVFWRSSLTQMSIKMHEHYLTNVKKFGRLANKRQSKKSIRIVELQYDIERKRLRTFGMLQHFVTLLILVVSALTIGVDDVSINSRSYYKFIADAYKPLMNQADFSERAIVYHWEGPFPESFGFPSGSVLLGQVTHGARILNGIPFEARSTSFQTHLNRNWPLDTAGIAYLRKANVRFVVYHFRRNLELNNDKIAEFEMSHFPNQDGLTFVYQNINKDPAATFMSGATDIVVYRVTG